MGIKETPTNFRVYYKSMQAYYSAKIEEANKIIDEFTSQVSNLKMEILDKALEYKDKYDISLSDYPEFRDNEYIDGKLYQASKYIFTKTGKDHLDANLWDLYNLAKTQKAIYDLRRDIEYYDRLVKLSIREYTEILRVYYTEVQKHMILNGEGYIFEGSLGWICINRCKSCKAAIKANMKISELEMGKLVGKVFKLENINTCPHGRPIVIAMSKKQIEKDFKRIV